MATTKKKTTSKKKMNNCGPSKGGIAIVVTMAKKPTRIKTKKKRT